MTGRPCPFCGVTRDFSALLSHGSSSAPLNAMSAALFGMVLFEIVWRLVLLLFVLRKPRAGLRGLIAADVALHVLLVGWIALRAAGALGG